MAYILLNNPNKNDKNTTKRQSFRSIFKILTETIIVFQ